MRHGSDHSSLSPVVAGRIHRCSKANGAFGPPPAELGRAVAGTGPDEAEPAYDRAPKQRLRITDRLLAEVAELYRDNIDSESA